MTTQERTTQEKAATVAVKAVEMGKWSMSTAQEWMTQVKEGTVTAQQVEEWEQMVKRMVK